MTIIQTDLTKYDLLPSRCLSCPFGGKKPIELHPDQLAHYYEQLLNGGSQHLCHSRDKTICRGGREIQLRWFHSCGLIDAPTDEDFNRAAQNLV